MADWTADGMKFPKLKSPGNFCDIHCKKINQDNSIKGLQL